METKNICKFSISRSSDLICTNFIFETQGGQQHPSKAASHIIGLTAQGVGKLRVGSQTHPLETGTLFFIPRYTEFSITPSADLHYCYISFHGRRGDEFLERMDIHPGNCVFPQQDLLIPFWQECLAQAEEDNIDLLCESVLLYSLARLRPAKAANDDVLSQIVTLTQERFTEADLSLSGIAAEIGYDPKYLSALFRKKKGISYTQYLRDMRLRHAVFLMEEGIVSVKNIAILSGFRDPLYFSKVFTAAEGTSPKAYMAQLIKK
jgi:AraC-like DNA-binding protein